MVADLLLELVLRLAHQDQPQLVLNEDQYGQLEGGGREAGKGWREKVRREGEKGRGGRERGG